MNAAQLLQISSEAAKIVSIAMTASRMMNMNPMSSETNKLVVNVLESANTLFNTISQLANDKEGVSDENWSRVVSQWNTAVSNWNKHQPTSATRV